MGLTRRSTIHVTASAAKPPRIAGTWPVALGGFAALAMTGMGRTARCAAVAMGLISLLWPSMAGAEKITNQIAVFAALDKVTARIQPLEVPINKTVTFAGLKITPRVCYTRPPTEQPLTSSFVEVDEIQLDKSEKRIFTGWMFAQSPGIHAVEHPVFDVWLTNCKTPAEEKSPGNSWKPLRP